MAIEAIANLIESIVKSLVEFPDKVAIKTIEGDSTVILEIHVDPSDAGKVIGKKGRTINAIRTLIRAATSRNDKRIIMELV